jgi:multisubunit Na+/H+ antiporter MnhB subunit
MWFAIGCFYLGGFASATWLATHDHPALAFFALLVTGSMSASSRRTP